ncbi:MAG TPA: diacylglycerol kinase family protein, partial [Anaerolineae bacterium]
MDPIPFLVNLAARRAGDWPRVLRDLRHLGVAVRPVPVAAPEAWLQAVGREAAARPPAILLGGGDGSFSRALSPLLDSGIAVGFVPLGTGNGIARSFGISSPAAACRAIAQGRVLPASVARAGRAYFLNMASVGISVAVTAGLRPGLKDLLGHGAYPLSIARALLRRQPFDLVGSLDGDEIQAVATQVIVFNGRYVARPPGLGRITPAPVLSVGILPAFSLPRLGLAVLGLWSGLRADRAGLLYREASQIRIATTPRLAVNVDGEIIERTPLDIQVLQDALRVFVA